MHTAQLRNREVFSRWVFAACAGLAAPVAAEIPCGYEVTAIIKGPWCGDTFEYPPTSGMGITDQGEIVGHYTSCDIGPFEAFYWTAETGMLVLDKPPGFVEAVAWDIDSATGWIVGSLILGLTDRPFAALWIDGTPIDLGTFPGGNFSKAHAASNGHVAGTWGNNVTGEPGLQAFYWHDGQMIDLAPDLGTPDAEALGVNAAGQVVGWMGESFLVDSHAFIWDDGKVVDLGVIPGGFTALAHAINNADPVQVVGSGQIPADGFPFGVPRAFLWQEDAMVNLGTLPGFSFSSATDINDDGLAVGRLWGGPKAGALVYYDGVMMDLNDMLHPADAGLQWVAVAYAVNNLGQITGQGIDEEGDNVAVVLSPIEPPLGDLTCDGQVLGDDFTLLLKAWGPCPIGEACLADLDGDGAVGIIDLLILLANWG